MNHYHPSDASFVHDMFSDLLKNTLYKISKVEIDLDISKYRKCELEPQLIKKIRGYLCLHKITLWREYVI